MLKRNEKQFLKQQQDASLRANMTRARAISVGTCFGGVVEVSMRGNDGGTLWCPLQPVEAIELIHQLSAAVGCHIHMQPRSDFASWRDWKYTDQELERFRGEQPLQGVGHAPHANPLPLAEQQPGLQPALMAKEIQDEQAVATEKTL